MDRSTENSAGGQRGATEHELAEHRMEIERLHWRLASLMRGSPDMAA
jgi:hypothetical protein